MKDILGNNLAVGDLVAIAMSYGRSNAKQQLAFIENMPPGRMMTIRKVEKPRSYYQRSFTNINPAAWRFIKIDPDSFEWPEDWERQ